MLSAALTAGESLACWVAVSLQPSPRTVKKSLTGLLPFASAAAGVSSARVLAAGGSVDGSLDGSGAAAAPRDGVSCTPPERWLHPAPAGCELHLVGRVIRGLSRRVQ